MTSRRIFHLLSSRLHYTSVEQLDRMCCHSNCTLTECHHCSHVLLYIHHNDDRYLQIVINMTLIFITKLKILATFNLNRVGAPYLFASSVRDIIVKLERSTDTLQFITNNTFIFLSKNYIIGIFLD